MPSPFDLREISHRAKNATLEKLPQLFCMFLCYIHKKTTQLMLKHHGEEGTIFQCTEVYYYLRSTMTDERLNGLALMFVNSDITLDYDAVIDEFGKSNRRLQFC